MIPGFYWCRWIDRQRWAVLEWIADDSDTGGAFWSTEDGGDYGAEQFSEIVGPLQPPRESKPRKEKKDERAKGGRPREDRRSRRRA
jgi:hypothetical protein